MTPVELSRTVLRAVRRAVDVGELSVAVPASVAVTPPGPGGCGDYATNVALRLAGPAALPALEVADILLPYLAGAPGVAGVTVTGPGFLNIALEGEASTGLVEEILELGERYGYGDSLAGQVVELRVPYDTRAEVVADTLVRIVATQGGRAEVQHAEPVNLRPVPAPEDPAPLGADAARWALLHPAPHDRPRISADHLLQRESNPLFRVRYAHARTRALRRNAAALGFTRAPHDVGVGEGGALLDARPAGASTGTLGASDTHGSAHSSTRDTRGSAHGSTRATHDTRATHHTRDAQGMHATREPHGTQAPAPLTSPAPPTPHQADLLVALAEYPHVLRVAARHRGPDRLARQLVVVADAVLGFQHVVLPFGDEKPSAAHRARLALAEAAGTVLAGGLSLLGISAPEYL
ncbi:ArgS-related anticodon-binding protein NrtL [Streptomyces sp. NPDC002580]|uniref:ArgS-related anticodon-binding protein NrtL n=1 Tax=Streptomyces sp. NPDC002580 TaxID=3364653 RepID=UPI003677A6AB